MGSADPAGDIVTVRLIVHCDGTPADRPGMALARCRAYLPTRGATIDTARAEAVAAGWLTRWDPATWPAFSVQQDLCPSCARHVVEIDPDPRARHVPGIGRVIEPPITGPPS
jgi:hypothetical protein